MTSHSVYTLIEPAAVTIGLRDKFTNKLTLSGMIHVTVSADVADRVILFKLHSYRKPLTWNRTMCHNTSCIAMYLQVLVDCWSGAQDL